MILSSISVLVLIGLSGGEMSKGELAEKIFGRRVVAYRLENMCRVHLLRQEGPDYVVTERGRKLIRFSKAWRSFFFPSIP